MLLKSLRKIFFARSFRYLVAGGLTFLTDYGLFLLLHYIFGFPVVYANTTSFIFSVIVNFSLNKTWVFDGKHKQKVTWQFSIYFILALINLALTNIFIYLLVNAGVWAFVAKLILVAAVAVWNYIIYRSVIFKYDE